MRISDRKMFNEEQKKEYINHEEINAKGLKQYFERLCYIEEIYNKDIADMNIEELKTALISLNIRSITSRGHIISLLKGYIDWAIYNGKTSNENKIDNIKPENISSQYAIKTQMLKSPEQVQSILDITFIKGYYEQENRGIRDNLIFWLLYTGMTIEELQILKKTDINYDKKIVANPKDNNIKYNIDDKTRLLWERCSEITYIEKSGGRHGTAPISYNLTDNEYLFRPIAGKKLDTNRMFGTAQFAQIIYKIFKTYFEETGEYILVSLINIKVSGIFYKLYILEKGGTEITPEIICEYLGIKYSGRREMLIKSRKYRIDYGDWKDAFGYK